MRGDGLCGVPVPPEHADAGQERLDLVDEPLRPEAQEADAVAAAPRTDPRDAVAPVAVVAHQLLSIARALGRALSRGMIRVRRGAAQAAHDVAAGAALDDARRPAAVQEQHRLRAVGQRLAQRVLERAAEDAAVPGHELFAHVHDVDVGQRGHGARALDAVRQPQAGERPALGPVRGAQVRRRAAEDDDGAA